jgi:hypothetical protein
MDWGAIWDGAKAVGKKFLTEEVKDAAYEAGGDILKGYFGKDAPGMDLAGYKDISLSGKYSLNVQSPKAPTRIAAAGEGDNRALIYSARWTAILNNARRTARSTIAKATVASPQTSRIAKKEKVV